jgi:hypothetical protein
VTLRSGLAVLHPLGLPRSPPPRASHRSARQALALVGPCEHRIQELITLNGEATYDSRMFDFEVRSGGA